MKKILNQKYVFNNKIKNNLMKNKFTKYENK